MVAAAAAREPIGEFGRHAGAENRRRPLAHLGQVVDERYATPAEVAHDVLDLDDLVVSRKAAAPNDPERELEHSNAAMLTPCAESPQTG
jgi:hypothetical protein